MTKMAKTKLKIDCKVIIAGIAALTIIEVVALLNGIDGVLLSSTVGIIALAIGVTIPNPLEAKK
jgi:hypothetical protein